METLRTETVEAVGSIVLCRADAYNTITPTLRDELSAAIDAADADPEVHVILLRAEGRAFCAGYGLDWSTQAQWQAEAQERQGGKAAAQRGRKPGGRAARPQARRARSEAEPSGVRGSGIPYPTCA